MVSSSTTKKKKKQKKQTSSFTSPLTAAHLDDNNNDDDDDNSMNDNDMIEKRRSSFNNDNDDNDDNDDNNNENFKRKIVKRARLEAEAAEEKRLTSLLFGDFNHTNNNNNDDDDDDHNDDIGNDSAWIDDDDNEIEQGGGDHEGLFSIDRSGVKGDGFDHYYENKNNNKNNHQLINNDNASYNEDDYDDDEQEDGEDNHIASSAWVDDDDDQIAVSLQTKSDRIKKLRRTMDEDLLGGKDYENRLRERFVNTSSAIARTDWANVDKVKKAENEKSLIIRDDNNNDDDDTTIDDTTDENEKTSSSASKILSSTASLLASSSHRLQPHILSVIRCPDANQTSYNQSTVQAVQFHPGSDEDEPLMLTAGLDKCLRFFKISNGGQESVKIHGINFPNLPIHSASFLGDSGSVVVSGRRPFFYIYDAAAGKIDKIPRINGRKEKSLEKFTTSPDGTLIAFIGNDGYIILVEAKSKMWVADLKMNGSVRAVTFTPDSKYILSSGSDGEVYRWDLRTKKCVDRFHNEDGTISSYVTASSKFLAVGAESGVVNMYQDGFYASQKSFYTTRKQDPVKSIMNLHTSVDYMKFNHDGQILAMSSRREKDSLKLLHVPTQTVFSNWPTTKTPLSYVWSLDFSPGSKYMAVGNDKGKCLLYKLSHYHEDV